MKNCIYCKKELLQKDNEKPWEFKIRNFCDRKCSASHNNSKRKIIIYCKFCKNPIINKNTTTQKYCSHKCQHDDYYQEFIKRWKNNQEDGMNGKFSISRHIKKYLFEKFNNKCSRCGWCEINQFLNKSPLEVEHIDGNYKNNKEENLTLLCPNCHSLTSTYKGLNAGKGRKGRNFPK